MAAAGVYEDTDGGGHDEVILDCSYNFHGTRL
eukprot:COSAG06_NODE_49626_length_324_cov_0.688889_1_plen_31_part_01